jgi:uncharacterized membrane protein
MEQDISLPIRELVDIAERALTPGSGDTTTAHEVIIHLGVILRELMLRDLPAPQREGDDGRWILRPREHSLDDYVDMSMDRIRIADTGSPDTAHSLLDTIGMLVRELTDAGLEERTGRLHEQADLIVAGAESRGLLEADVQTVRDRARVEGLGRATAHR